MFFFFEFNHLVVFQLLLRLVKEEDIWNIYIVHCTLYLYPVDRKMYNAFYWINSYLVDKC